MLTRNYYHRVHAAPTKQPTITPAIPHIGPLTSGFNALHLDETPFVTAGNVVAKSLVGFGEPLTMTVAAVGIEGPPDEAVADASRMVNRGEEAYI